ncbi:MAG: hypothetical protein R3D71_09185 [Rickettsiales bacterium]
MTDEKIVEKIVEKIFNGKELSAQLSRLENTINSIAGSRSKNPEKLIGEVKNIKSKFKDGVDAFGERSEKINKRLGRIESNLSGRARQESKYRGVALIEKPVDDPHLGR